MSTLTFNGSLHLILGNMFSGKTSELMRRYRRYKISGKSCAMIKYKGDNRYDDDKVTTHDNIKVDAFVCTLLSEFNERAKNYDVICVDEVQFYKDAYIFCDKWANEGKIVEACGLSGTFNRTPFLVVSRLIPLAEDIIILDAICVNTGNKAPFTKLLIENDGDTVEIIGGAEKYLPVDRLTFFGGDAEKCRNDMIEEFVKLGMDDLEIREKVNNDKF
jgi:thymidine kinase